MLDALWTWLLNLLLVALPWLLLGLVSREIAQFIVAALASLFGVVLAVIALATLLVLVAVSLLVWYCVRKARAAGAERAPPSSTPSRA